MTREEAIQAWEQMRSEIDNENWLFVGTINPQMVDIAIEALKTQDRPRGEWANDEHDIPRCSVCGYIPEFNNHIDDYYYSDFCPNCGADMRTMEGARND